MAKISEIILKYKGGEKVKLVTHAGRFHSDDVFATAILQLVLEKYNIPYKVVRTYSPKQYGYTDETPNCVVYDIGLGMYDHHQVGDDAAHCIREDKYTDENGKEHKTRRKYSSVGLLWQEIGECLAGEYANDVYESIIKYIDDHDNGFSNNPLSTLIKNMNTYDDFDTVVSWAYHAFKFTIYQYEELAKLAVKAEEALKSSNGIYIYTEKYNEAVNNVCKRENIPFYLYHDIEREVYCFKTVDITLNKHILDIPDEVRHWDGVTFLHPSRFLGSAVSKEIAISVVEKICKDTSFKVNPIFLTNK